MDLTKKQKQMYDECTFLNEKVTMGQMYKHLWNTRNTAQSKGMKKKFGSTVKVSSAIKPSMGEIEVYKAHKHPGFMNAVNKLNDAESLSRLREVIRQAITKHAKTAIRLETVEKYGKDSKEAKPFIGVITRFLEAEIKSSDAKATEEWFRNECLKACSDKIKSLKS